MERAKTATLQSPQPSCLGPRSPETDPLSPSLVPSPGRGAPEAGAAPVTSLKAATLATTDATSPAPPSPPSPLLSSAVPSEPARRRSPRWKAAVPPAPSTRAGLAKELPAHLLCCPGHRLAAEGLSPGHSGSGSGVVRVGSTGSSRFGSPSPSPRLFLPRGSLGAGGWWRPRHFGTGGFCAQMSGEAPWMSHWSLPPLGPGVMGREDDLARGLLL